jgi:GNAT superfamily N-acetyltransferase
LMLLIDRSPAAILIVERICKGGGYLDDFRSSQTESDGHDSDRFRGYGKPDVVKSALMSVDRIWVGEKHRRKGLATALINHARNVLIPGLEIRRSQVAFSWPTTLGRALATRYSLGQHEEAIPFLVNLADCPDV